MRPVSRREMLAALAGSLTAFTVSAPARMGAFARRGVEHARESELDAWLTSQLGGTDVRSTAGAWRALHPAESSRDVLTRAILAGRRNREPLEDYLARVVATEHRDGRAESVDGWMLAPTEARLATLLDLAKSR
jgi:hypothetical protein